MVPIHLPAARGALRQLAPAGRRPTRHEITQRARLAREQTTPEEGAHGGPGATDDVRHLPHGALARSAEPIDEVRQRIQERGPDLLRQMRVDLRRAGAPMAERLLNDPEMDVRFQ